MDVPAGAPTRCASGHRLAPRTLGARVQSAGALVQPLDLARRALVKMAKSRAERAARDIARSRVTIARGGGRAGMVPGMPVRARVPVVRRFLVDLAGADLPSVTFRAADSERAPHHGSTLPVRSPQSLERVADPADRARRTPVSILHPKPPTH
jgi:hypothetical protein